MSTSRCPLILLGCLTTLAVAPRVHSQTNVSLDIELYAGLNVTGTVGQLYQVQYATGLSETNTWYALQHLELKWNPYKLVDTTCPASERRFYRTVEVEVPTNVVPVTNMVFIPPGTFMMGSPTNEPLRQNDETNRQVTISHFFWMGKYEVTQGEYLALMGDNPSYFGGLGANLPVEKVRWYEAVAYGEELTAREAAAGRLPAGYEYRLPTETEWEYACRAGTTTPFHYGHALRSGMANFDGQGEYPPCEDSVWYCHNPSGIFIGRTADVGSYAPNAWGLYDMHGNVREFCTDQYGEYIGRGGDWHSYAYRCRSAARDLDIEDHRYFDLGFRIVLVPIQP